MIFAQSFVEYGSVSGGAQHLVQRIRLSIRNADNETYLMLGGVMLACLWLWSRRKS